MTTSQDELTTRDPGTAGLRSRPGRNLLVALEILGKELADFAVEAGMSTRTTRNKYTDKLAANNALRKYTHPSPGGSLSGRPSPKWPSPEMVTKWAALLDVDFEFFYLKHPSRSAAARELRLRAQALRQAKE
jgi:hypothetical protein